MSGHDLHRQIVAKHGVDRYQTTELTIVKLVEELGELAREILRGNQDGIAKEYGDVGLTLYGLGGKLGLDLDEMMRAVVRDETRVFVREPE